MRRAGPLTARQKRPAARGVRYFERRRGSSFSRLIRVPVAQGRSGRPVARNVHYGAGARINGRTQKCSFSAVALLMGGRSRPAGLGAHPFSRRSLSAGVLVAQPKAEGAEAARGGFFLRALVLASAEVRALRLWALRTPHSASGRVQLRGASSGRVEAHSGENMAPVTPRLWSARVQMVDGLSEKRSAASAGQ